MIPPNTKYVEVGLAHSGVIKAIRRLGRFTAKTFYIS